MYYFKKIARFWNRDKWFASDILEECQAVHNTNDTAR
jgi:hypothetical protein